MRTVCFIQARLNSHRLPGKILMDLAGQPMLAHVVARARQIPGVAHCAVLTAWPDRDILAAALPGVEVCAFPIPIDDVLTRYALMAEATQAHYIVRVTGDCPMFDPVVGGRVVAEAQARRCYATNDTTISGYPDGHDCQVWPLDALLRESVEATDPLDREHPGRWADRQPERALVCAPYQAGPSTRKLSVDTQSDLDYVRSLLRGTHG